MNTYGLQVVPIPTNRTMVRADQADKIYKSEVAKFDAVVDDLVERYDSGQPVLVGTISVEKSEYLSSQLRKRGIPHEVLNAKQHTREASIVAQAGRLGAVTVATNMAGRGVDIILGGNPEGLARQEVLREGFPHEALVDEFDLPAPLDELPEEYQQAPRRGPGPLRRAAREVHAPSARPRATRCARLGGLYVLGTERHESRRIDNQLRGRSGRQGDPGESRFYLSLDDELMRLFATGAMSWVMGKALPDDVPIEAKMVTKAIERAQNTVEQRNAEIRKNVLKYDEVMNQQRKVIYTRRDQILDGADLRETAHGGARRGRRRHRSSTYCVADASDEWDLEGLIAELQGYWPTELTVEQLEECASTDEIDELALAEATAHYERREDELDPGADPRGRAPGDAAHHRPALA